MAVWLWVSDLDPKNDWLELLSFSSGTGWSRGSARASPAKDIQVVLKPGRFGTRLFSWAVNGQAKTVYVFFDPQTEYQYSGALATGVSTSSDGIFQVSINYDSMKVEHSGAP
jgi:hypothetical protein